MSDDKPRLPSGKIDMQAFEAQMRRNWQDPDTVPASEVNACARRAVEIDIQFLLWWHSEIDNGTDMSTALEAAASSLASACANMMTRIKFEDVARREAFPFAFFNRVAGLALEYSQMREEEIEGVVVPPHMGNA